MIIFSRVRIHRESSRCSELLGQPLVKSNFEPVAHPLESGENARYTSFINHHAFCGHMTMRG